MANNLNKNRSKKYVPYVILSICCVSFGFLGGYLSKPRTITSYAPVRENNDKYVFIHPLLATNFSKQSNSQYNPLLNNIKNFLQEKEKSGSLDTASVYLINYSENKSLS